MCRAKFMNKRGVQEWRGRKGPGSRERRIKSDMGGGLIGASRALTKGRGLAELQSRSQTSS